MNNEFLLHMHSKVRSPVLYSCASAVPYSCTQDLLYCTAVHQFNKDGAGLQSNLYTSPWKKQETKQPIPSTTIMKHWMAKKYPDRQRNILHKHTHTESREKKKIWTTFRSKIVIVMKTATWKDDRHTNLTHTTFDPETVENLHKHTHRNLMTYSGPTLNHWWPDRQTACGHSDSLPSFFFCSICPPFFRQLLQEAAMEARLRPEDKERRLQDWTSTWTLNTQ